MDRFFSLLQTTTSCCKWIKFWLGSGFVGCPPGHHSWTLVVLFVHKWNLIRYWVWNKTFRRWLCLLSWNEGWRRHGETSEGHWSVGFLGKEVGYEISTCQMQYDAADKKTDQEDPCFVYFRGNDLENVESIKYLGVTITSDLRWNTHVSNVCTNANRTLGFLRRNLYSCPQEVKEAAYKGLVRPVLDYSSSVWDRPQV